MYARAAQAGIRVVAGSIIPYNTATPGAERAHAADQRVDAGAARGLSSSIPARPRRPPDNADRLFDSPDGLHPTAAGYRRMADAIGPVLERALR